MKEVISRYKYNELAPSLIKARKTLFPKQDTKLNSDLPSSFFILGSGRNGSTVLSRHLNGHPEIFMSPEMWELPL